jgi:D-glycero-beta-D-manno-heptose-7-phosphate kinase
MIEIRKKLIETIQHFGDIKVLVIGDVMLDVYEFCHSENSKPIDSEQPGKRAYRSHEIIKELGGAGNVAANLASLQIPVSLVGITGNDEHYHKIVEIAESQNISYFLHRDLSRSTTVKARLYVDDEYLLRRDDENIHKIYPEVSVILIKRILSEIPKCNVVILSDYNKGVFIRENTQKIINKCKKNNIPVIVDFKPENAIFFKGADLMVPNDTEAKQLLSEFSYDELEKSMSILHKKLHCKKLVVTLGANGICGFDGTNYFHVPGNKVKTVDAVGCGDTVRAALAVGIALELSLKDAAILANDAAAVIVQKPATASITQQELIEFIKNTII